MASPTFSDSRLWKVCSPILFCSSATLCRYRMRSSGLHPTCTWRPIKGPSSVTSPFSCPARGGFKLPTAHLRGKFSAALTWLSRGVWHLPPRRRRWEELRGSLPSLHKLQLLQLSQNPTLGVGSMASASPCPPMSWLTIRWLAPSDPQVLHCHANPSANKSSSTVDPCK